nr:hypothetical protein [Tanacetum cinerariifolium]GEY06248.1 hypothetical protein [Tanacetum cinerariifolium]
MLKIHGFLLFLGDGSSEGGWVVLSTGFDGDFAGKKEKKDEARDVIGRILAGAHGDVGGMVLEGLGRVRVYGRGPGDDGAIVEFWQEISLEGLLGRGWVLDNYRNSPSGFELITPGFSNKRNLIIAILVL